MAPHPRYGHAFLCQSQPVKRSRVDRVDPYLQSSAISPGYMEFLKIQGDNTTFTGLGSLTLYKPHRNQPEKTKPSQNTRVDSSGLDQHLSSPTLLLLNLSRFKPLQPPVLLSRSQISYIIHYTGQVSSRDQ